MITKPVCNPHSKWIFTRRRRHRWSAILVSFLLNTHPNESLSLSLSILLSLFSVCFSVWYSHIAKLTTAPPSSSKLRLQYNPWWPTMTGVQRIRVFIPPPPASIHPSNKTRTPVAAMKWTTAMTIAINFQVNHTYKCIHESTTSCMSGYADDDDNNDDDADKDLEQDIIKSITKLRPNNKTYIRRSEWMDR